MASTHFPSSLLSLDSGRRSLGAVSGSNPESVAPARVLAFTCHVPNTSHKDFVAFFAPNVLQSQRHFIADTLERTMSMKPRNTKEKTMTAGNAIRKLVMAHAHGDAQQFRAALGEYIKEERRKRHHQLADDLERIFSNGAPSSKVETLTLFRPSGADLPRDKEKGTLLLELFEPTVSLSEMVVNDPVSGSLERIVSEQRRRDVLMSYGLSPLRKILFCGPPGCGKTMAAEALAKELYLPLVLVRFDAVISSYLGETAANLRRVFDFAASRPMVLLFDEFDAIGKKRDDTEEHGELKRVVNAFLQMLDSSRGDALTIAATNHERMLDPALWRRFDEVIVFPSPSVAQIEELLKRHLRQVGTSEINWGVSSSALSGSSHAEVKRVAEDATKICLLSGATRVDGGILEQAIKLQKERLDLQQALS
jgi:SpoVK/Ycf46/Vps4 family AAA+-type ATPase